jgi:hypothetical protein
MATVARGTSPSLASAMLSHMLTRLEDTAVHDKPYSHFYVERFFPNDVYDEMMRLLPAAKCYKALSIEKHQNTLGASTRDVLPLNEEGLNRLPREQHELWGAVAAALVAPELKRAVFRKLATDLAHRFGLAQDRVPEIVSYTRPSLFRDLEGYEIAPHPDGRAKIVTMQLYLPIDRSQLHLGTAVYSRALTSLKGLVSWRGRFRKVKQFAFQPNSGYAFAVSNSLGRKSWHGREAIPPGSGVRNSILNIFFAEPDRTY